jgi:hypothetical protein
LGNAVDGEIVSAGVVTLTGLADNGAWIVAKVMAAISNAGARNKISRWDLLDRISDYRLPYRHGEPDRV